VITKICFWFRVDADRGGVPDLSVSGDKSDLVVVDSHDPTTASETRSANVVTEPTPDGTNLASARLA
jgi:hypothetical protein